MTDNEIASKLNNAYDYLKTGKSPTVVHELLFRVL